MYKIKKILSYFPVISFSDDENFGELTRDVKKIRFSFLRVSCGIYKFYFFTYKKDHGWEFFRKICLYDIQKEFTDEESQCKAKEYGKKISRYDDKVIDVHIEALQYKMSQLEDTMAGSLNKLMFYYVILMGLIGAIIAWIMNSKPMFSFIQLIVIYFLANIWLFSWEFIRIRGWPRFSFHDFKESADPKKKFAESIYYEWYFTRNRVPIFVSCVKNIEKYFKYISLIGIVLIVYLFAERVKYFFNPKEYTMSATSQDHESKLIFDLSLPLKDILSEKSIAALRKIQNGLAINEYSQIILVRTTDTKTDVYNEIVKQLIFYNVNKALLTEIVLTDIRDSDKNLLTIVPIRREK